MPKNILTPELSSQLARLYQRMADAYERVAGELSFTCEGCPDNCCDSFFLHHTLIEWTYLWQGLNELEAEKLALIRARSQQYLAACSDSLVKGERPQVMCPLNREGLCILYKHRLMICRMHGVPSSFTLPDGRKQEFPGCFRCQEITAEREDTPQVDRTDLYRELAGLEKELRIKLKAPQPRIKMTIAEMIVSGPPKI